MPRTRWRNEWNSSVFRSLSCDCSCGYQWSKTSSPFLTFSFKLIQLLIFFSIINHSKIRKNGYPGQWRSGRLRINFIRQLIYYIDKSGTAMHSNASNEFTFKALSSHNQSIRNSKDINQTIHESLPKRQRRHKIFEESPLFRNQRHNSSYKKNRSPIFDKSQGKNASILQEANYKVGTKENDIKEEKVQVAFTSAYKEMIEKKLASKGTGAFDYPKEKLFEELSRKQREIKVLKLEIERSKRCENLNKTNEQLYKRLIVKMKDSPVIKVQEPHKQQQIYQVQRTPISSLTDIRFTPKKQTPQSSPKKEENHSASNKLTQTVPLMTIPQHQQNHLVTQTNTQTPNLPKNKGESANKAYHSPIKNQFYESDPVFLKLQEEVNASKSRYKTNLQDVPVQQRLTAINRALQSSFTEYSRRHSNHHSSHRKERASSIAKGSHRHL